MSSKEDSFVVFEKVQKSYDGLSLVVKDLNLHIKKGEFLTMLGPSGSGKTTFLRLCLKEDKPSAGGMSIIKTIGYFSMFLSVLYDWPVS